jgi:predicted transcriptional regulator
MALTRISMTIPAALLKAADRRAKALRRSRSWVIVEALREFLGEQGSKGSQVSHGREGSQGAAVREAVEHPYAAAAEIAEGRRGRLRAELTLPPAERLRRGWELGQLGRERQPRGRRAQVIAFENYEDYYEWKKGRLIGR